MIIAIGEGISLHIKKPDRENQSYPSCRIQKGPLIFHENRDLSEEGVGFGVPILKFGEMAVFPGSGQFESMKRTDRTQIMISYNLNIVEMIAIRGNNIQNRIIHSVKESLSRLHREYDFSRKLLAAGSNVLRQSLGIITGFEEIPSVGVACMKYIITSDGMIHIRADLSRIKKEGCTEIMIMNEQGANYFDTYSDSNGTILLGNSIGSWQETSCNENSFIHAENGLAFTLTKIDGSKMFYGRELVKNRLSWSGIAYSIPPYLQNFAYYIKIGFKK
jgi:hypothetical protein